MPFARKFARARDLTPSRARKVRAPVSLDNLVSVRMSTWSYEIIDIS